MNVTEKVDVMRISNVMNDEVSRFKFFTLGVIRVVMA